MGIIMQVTKMMKNRGRDVLGKILVSEETGRKFGVVGDINFVAESGELLNVVLVEPTKHSSDLNLEKDENNRLLVPFSAVRSVGDFVIISEKEIV
jgi:sporulation protein YlmC with PRC-barrel domain